MGDDVMGRGPLWNYFTLCNQSTTKEPPHHDGNSPPLTSLLKSFLIFLLDICSFCGTLWFLLTRLLFGPMNTAYRSWRGNKICLADIDKRQVFVAEKRGE